MVNLIGNMFRAAALSAFLSSSIEANELESPAVDNSNSAQQELLDELRELFPNASNIDAPKEGEKQVPFKMPSREELEASLRATQKMLKERQAEQAEWEAEVKEMESLLDEFDEVNEAMKTLEGLMDDLDMYQVPVEERDLMREMKKLIDKAEEVVPPAPAPDLNLPNNTMG